MARSRASQPPPAEGRNHEPGVAEDLLAWTIALALDHADEGVRGDLDVIEVERGGVRQPQAVLVLGGAER